MSNRLVMVEMEAKVGNLEALNRELLAQLAVAKEELGRAKEFERREIARAYFAAACANSKLAEIDPMDHIADACFYAEALQKALDGGAALPKPRLTVTRRRMLK
jgi:hypothetical protein